ncbi:MAG: methyl-accepting chemotaxis protein [Deltaproteobacteria bacterium]|nr:methyl-accepting chemotaxis protein [Deltaproteobacteria bacterium]
MKTLSLEKKIVSVLLIALGVVLAALLGGSVILYSQVMQTTDEKADALNQRIQASLTLSDTLYKEMVLSGLKSLRESAKAFGAPNLGEPVTLGERTVPAMRFGSHSVFGNHQIVDKTKELVGGTATIFVKSGSEFVRISTNVKKDDGSRAVGTVLDPAGKAIKAINASRPYYGVVYILGNPYFTGYEPLLNESGETIGIWYTGYRLDSMTALAEGIKASHLLQSGFVALFDDRNRPLFSSSTATKEVLENAALQSLVKDRGATHQENSGWFFKRHAFDAWDYTIITAVPRADLVREAAWTVGTVIGPQVLVVLTMMVLGFLGIRFLSRRLRKSISGLGESSEGLRNAAEQLAGASESMAAGASQQAAGLEEVSSTLAEMTRMVQDNAETASQLNSMAGEFQKSAQQGTQAMVRMETIIGEVGDASNNTARIIKTIDEIAFQTNLLALNAAVEAARAGDSGRGFAVVAEEVRNLAKRSAEAAKETTVLIQAAQEKSKQGQSAAKEVGAVFTNVNQGVERMVSLAQQVAESSGQQSQGIGQISSSMDGLDQTTQSNAAMAEETSSSSNEMVRMVDLLNQVVGGLKRLVGGSLATQEAPSWSGEVLDSSRPSNRQLL